MSEERLTRFGRALREKGLPVGTGRIAEFCRAAGDVWHKARRSEANLCRRKYNRGAQTPAPRASSGVTGPLKLDWDGRGGWPGGMAKASCNGGWTLS